MKLYLKMYIEVIFFMFNIITKLKHSHCTCIFLLLSHDKCNFHVKYISSVAKVDFLNKFSS